MELFVEITDCLSVVLVERHRVIYRNGIYSSNNRRTDRQRLNLDEAFVIPREVHNNICRLENSPHVIQRFVFACDAMRVSLGPIKVMQYTLQGLWHPARKVREPCWKVFNNIILVNQALLKVISD